MSEFKWSRMVGLLALAVPLAIAQPPAPPQETPTTPAAAAPTPPSPWTRHGVDVYLLGDVYGDLNFNHPASGYNQIYN